MLGILARVLWGADLFRVLIRLVLLDLGILGAVAPVGGALMITGLLLCAIGLKRLINQI